MVDHFPVVDLEACVGCGTCVRTCPKHIIELMPMNARIWVPCSTKDPGKTVKGLCGVGCISCKMCVKACPAKAVSLEDNVVRIDHKTCMEYGPQCDEVCVEKCPRDIFRYYREKEKEEPLAATG
jgi:electron transport complex protein RnfB